MSKRRTGRYNFYDRDDLTAFTHVAGDLAARTAGQDAVSPFSLSDADAFRVPRSVAVTYIDSEANADRGSEVEYNRTSVGGQDVRFDLPYMSTGAKARALATRGLFDAMRHAQMLEGSLPPNALYLRENDKLQVPGFGENYELALTRVAMGANGVVRFQGVVMDVTTFKELGLAGLGTANVKIGTGAPVRIVIFSGS